jgi:hypothetical protein
MAVQYTEEAVHVGTPPSDFREWSRTSLYFHRFEDLPAERSNPWGVVSEEFKCGGVKYAVGLHPGGFGHVEEGMASIILFCDAHEPLNIEYGFSFKDSTGREVGGGASRVNNLEGTEYRTIWYQTLRRGQHC